jgi:luciferase family oxidoreductase group 1
MIPFSVLDLSPIVQGGSAALALRNTRDLAQHAERLGYRRFWLAEHHNMTGIASAATAVVIGHVAAATSTIRVGAGGIMLPNHSPLVIAEQFGTLETLFSGRIDLGVGRAPGTDPLTARALRRAAKRTADTFPEDVVELASYFRAPLPGEHVRAVPGFGLHVPIWILGSSTFGAQLAAAMGLPYAFASHFAPDDLDDAVAIYRRDFRPSDAPNALRAPYVMLGVGVYAAETDREAVRLFSSIEQAFVKLRSGEPGPLPPPVDSTEGMFADFEEAMLERALACSFVGSKETVTRELGEFLASKAPDEIIVTAQIFDHAARVRSFEILADVRAELATSAG